MSVKLLWTIDHVCGHTADVDLSDRPADRRAGYARWLAGRDCADCWRTTRDHDTKTKTAWLTQKRAEEQSAAEEWSEQYLMPPLEGTERAIAWAVRCRHQLVRDAYTALVVEGTTSETEWEALEDLIRRVTRAGWWLDQRDATPTDLPELLEAAAAASASGTENPYF